MFAVGCLALISPRLALVLVWIFGDGYIGRAIEPAIWAVLGLVFLPLTTLTFAYAVNSQGPAGDVTQLGWVLVVVAALVDLGILRGGHRATRNKPSE